MYGDLVAKGFSAVNSAFNSLVLVVLVTVPLALWKLWDLANLLYSYLTK